MPAALLAGALVAELLAASAVIAAPKTPVADTSAAAVARSARPVNLAGADGAALLRRVDAAMGSAIADVERFWDADWPAEIVVVATDTAARFAEQADLDRGHRWDDIAAVAVADTLDTGSRRASGQRIVLAPGASGMSEESLRIVLTHELFHLAARVETAVDAPRWITEGVADFVARRPAPLPPPDERGPASLPRDSDLDVAGPARSAGYDRAWWFARFVAEEYGTDGLRRFYRAACGPGHRGLGAAAREGLGEDLAAVARKWERWLAR